MSSVSSVNPGVSDVLQILAGNNYGSSLLSSPGVQASVQNGSPSDVVQFSQAALQLQETSGLFGFDTTGSGAAVDPTVQILQAQNTALDSTIPASATASTSASISASTAASATAPSAAAAAYATSSQEISDLFGTSSVSLAG